MDKEICKLAAKVFAGKNWHHDLTADGHELVKKLEEAGYLTPAKGGFVGKAIN